MPDTSFKWKEGRRVKLVVGLGNPGPKYSNTRHNVGFWVIDALSKRLGIDCNKQKWQSVIGEGRVGSERVILCKPLTYMNLSGEAVHEVVQFYSELSPSRDLIIVYDDMDFAPGVMKLREVGSAGGHNGVKSLMQNLGGESFPRIRIGVGRPPAGVPVITHVLTPFAPSDEQLVQQTVERACEAIEYALNHSFTAAMNRFNEQKM